MISIAHLADLHIFNETRHEEYRKNFEKLYTKLKKIQPDRIVICGDIFESKINISNESKLLAAELLNNLSKIAKVTLTLGNHDILMKSLFRIDSIETIVKLINNPNVEYLNKTGFYQDGKITWVVYHHADRNLNIDPWNNQIKDPNQIYIGLFHDPVNGSSTDVGKVFNDKSYKDVSYFDKNDYMMLGDIHKRQYFRKNKSMAYVGSTIQKDFGELIEHHGFLLWKIKDAKTFEVEEHDIPNDHNYVNFYINEDSDYDNLNLKLDSSHVYSESEIKVHWKDYSSNITTENEKKIRDFIKKKYNIVKVKFDKVYIYTDVISSKMLSESLDLNDIDVQKSIFKEYLVEQKYKEDDIKEILKIDEIISNRLQIKEQKNNIVWEIEKFWFSNFKSFGDDNIIDWKDFDGIIQLNGINKAGKTTIIDAITYILYGTTTTTLKKEKFGDNRYLNNKRDLNYCLGGAVINADGEKFIIQRRTDRKIGKSGEIASCPTVLDFYKSDIISEENKLTGERRNKTQKKLDLIIGEFKDFIRLSHVNADTLNDLLSSDRSEFIDNIIRDAGYDIFELKLEEFKEYKKDLNEEKLVVDCQESDNRVKILNSDIKVHINELKDKKSNILEFEKSLQNDNLNRDNLIKNLHKIDDSINSFDSSDTIETIDNYKSKIEETKIQIVILENEINKLPTKFETERINLLKIKLKELTDKVILKKQEIFNIKNNNIELDAKKDKVLSKIKELKDKEIQKLKDEIKNYDIEITKINTDKDKIINERLNYFNSELQTIELEKTNISNKIKLLQNDGLNYKNRNKELDVEIEELKNSKVCPTCGREYDDGYEHLSHLEEKIQKLNNEKSINDEKIKILMLEYNKIKASLPELKLKEDSLVNKKRLLNSGVYEEEILILLNNVGSIDDIKNKILQIRLRIEEVKSDVFVNTEKLKEYILQGQKMLIDIEKSKSNNFEVIKNLDNELKSFNIESVEDDIAHEERLKENYELRKQKISLKENLILNIEKNELMINESQIVLNNYEKNKTQIEENKETHKNINVIDEHVVVLKNNINEINDVILDIEKEITIKKKDIENITIKLNKYLKQKKKEELFKEFSKCVSRDGIPTYLLKKSIHIINKELGDLLSNVDFTLFFDENLILRMSADDRLDVSQNVITSSGMERTFCSLALKIALRQVNIKSKSNMLLLDEIMVKLINESVTQFIDFLDLLKTKLKKIIIIEHVHSINYDALIEVKKDDYTLISSLEVKK